ncbi:MAG: hypothetical protein ABI831_24875 [Betaproteobacteria bacterium]
MSTASPYIPQFPLLGRGRARRYGTALLAAMALIIAAIAFIDYAVDPFQQYRRPAWYEPHYYRTLQRFINPGIAKRYDYDTVITGSSMMENFSNAEAGAILHGKVVNLAMGAMTAYELHELLATIIAGDRARHIVVDLNFNAFAGSPAMQVVTDPLPLYLYDSKWWNDGRYLLQAQTLARSAEILLGWRRGRFATDPDKPWYWADEYEFSGKATMRGLDPANINRDFKQGPRTLEGMRASFDANLLPMLRDHPQLRFSLVYPPYSALVWTDFAQRDQVEVSLAFKRYVFDAVKSLPNVALYDFQPRREWVTNLDNYKDIYHFSPAISRAMLEAIAQGSDRVDVDSIGGSEAVLRSLSQSTH